MLIRKLLHFPTTFLSVPLASQRLLGPFLLSRLQVKRVPFDLFDDVLLLNLALEPAEGIFQRFALLQFNFGQLQHLPSIWKLAGDFAPDG
jgi:hypothetical protein